jgi:hypothetical protein
MSCALATFIHILNILVHYNNKNRQSVSTTCMHFPWNILPMAHVAGAKKILAEFSPLLGVVD